MDSAISDLALDLGVFALDNEIENGMSGANASPTRSASAKARSLKVGRSHQEGTRAAYSAEPTNSREGQYSLSA